MTVRRLLLAIHLWVGVAAALFLFIAALTGSVLAFEPDYDRWLHPGLWRASTTAAPVSEQGMADLVTSASGAAIRVIAFNGTGRAQIFDLADGREVFVDPSRATILGTRDGHTRLKDFLFAVRRLHVQLFANQWGEWTVDIATTAALLLVPTGLILWWRKKRVAVLWRSSWRRILYDLHAVLGIFGSLFVLVLIVTGFLMAFEPALHFVTRTEPALEPDAPHSTVPVDPASAARPSLDAILAAADRALPDEPTSQIVLPESRRGAVRVVKTGRFGVGSSVVFIDAFAGTVLRVDDFAHAPGAERAHTINQALHTGRFGGLFQRLLIALASLCLAGVVLTGVLFWARRFQRRPAVSGFLP
jgi:uncharacterized iron-regulated membrane protein